MPRPYRKSSDLKPRLLTRLKNAGSRFVTVESLMSAYYDQGDDEPEDAHGAIWKLIRSLRNDGWNIEGRQNRGYRLIAQREAA